MRIRLILSFALIVLVSVTSVVVIASQNTASEVRAFMYRGGMTSSTELVENLSSYYQTNGSWQGVEDILMPAGGGFGRRSGGMSNSSGTPAMGAMMDQRIRLADASGQILVDSGDQLNQPLSTDEMKAAQAIRVNLKTVGYLLIQGGMNYSNNEEANLLNRLNRAAVTAAMIAGGVSLLLALLLTYRLLRPVNALTQAAENLGKGDLSQRVEVKGSDELATLAHTFNHMANSLQKAQKSRRDLTADVAHELRTPLAVQRANLEALQDGIYEPTPDNLASILEQNILLSRLVDDLRTLALVESGELPLEKTPSDFVPLVRRIVDRFRSQADLNQVELQVIDEGHDDLSLPLDAMRFEQIISNLLSNALRHTPPGGKIFISIQRFPEKLQLAVQDSGPGIPEESLPHIFERFYRADRSRSRAEGGTGLGLAIALNLAQLHGWELSAGNSSEGGARFILSMPSHSGQRRGNANLWEDGHA